MKSYCLQYVYASKQIHGIVPKHRRRYAAFIKKYKAIIFFYIYTEFLTGFLFVLENLHCFVNFHSVLVSSTHFMLILQLFYFGKGYFQCISNISCSLSFITFLVQAIDQSNLNQGYWVGVCWCKIVLCIVDIVVLDGNRFLSLLCIWKNIQETQGIRAF